MKKKIEMILDKLQIPIDLAGYKYWITMLEKFNEDKEAKITALYIEVAKEHHTTYIRVERSLRHAVNKCENKIQRYFNVDYKITNKRFLCLILREVNK